jgi:regulator of sirC expression with transglutaminase-like and TPR domain
MSEEVTRLGLVDEAEIELDRAALEIAALDHVDADPSPYLDLLEEMEDRLRAGAATAVTSARQAMALTRVLAAEFHFEGDRDTYDDPVNADLFSVIDRRRGLPVALAILYVALARRMGWAACALNVPGHVLVGVGNPLVVVDPFNGGAIVPPEQLAMLLRAAFGPAGAVEQRLPMSNRAVLVRLLMNQASRAEQADELDRALTVLERITTVAPEYSGGWWDRARLERSRGNAAAARECLSSMLETTRDPALRQRANRALEGLAE